MRSNSDKKKRLTIIVTAKVTASTFVSGFARYIASEGFEVTIIADGLEPSTVAIGNGTVRQIPVSMARNPHPVMDFFSLVELIRQLRAIKPHIVTYATPKASLLGSIASFTLRSPVRVYQLWGLRLETVHGLKHQFLKLLEKLTSLLSTKILANSSSLAYRYRELGLHAGRGVDVLGEGSSHGVDLDYFAQKTNFPPLALGKSESPLIDQVTNYFVIGFIGRLHPDKGINTLLDAVRLLHAEGVPLKLILVGENEGAKLDLSQGIQNDVITVGHVTDTRSYYSMIDLLVLPSLREGFPNVVLEAAAMSIPAVVSDGTGVVDSVIDGVTGFVVPVGNPVLLAERIRLVANNRELRQKLGEGARDRVVQSFSQREVWNRTLTYLTE